MGGERIGRVWLRVVSVANFATDVNTRNGGVVHFGFANSRTDDSLAEAEREGWRVRPTAPNMEPTPAARCCMRVSLRFPLVFALVSSVFSLACSDSPPTAPRVVSRGVGIPSAGPMSQRAPTAGALSASVPVSGRVSASPRVVPFRALEASAVAGPPCACSGILLLPMSR